MDSSGKVIPRRTTSVMYSNLGAIQPGAGAPPVPPVPSMAASRLSRQLEAAGSAAPLPPVVTGANVALGSSPLGRSASMARARNALMTLGGTNTSSRSGRPGLGAVTGQPDGGYRQYFRRYELMIEYANLANPNHCPKGMYVLPDPLTPTRVWHGVLFISHGYFRDAVFRFRIHIPEAYPTQAPSVHFLTDVYHPLVNADRRLALLYRFPQWRPRRDHMFHLLTFIRDAFGRKVLDAVPEEACPNREAIHLLRNEPGIFARLAQQSARMSLQDANLYGDGGAGGPLGGAPGAGGMGSWGDDDDGMGPIRFSKLTDKKLEEIKRELFDGYGDWLESEDKAEPDVARNTEQVMDSFRQLSLNVNKFLDEQ